MHHFYSTTPTSSKAKVLTKITHSTTAIRSFHSRAIHNTQMPQQTFFLTHLLSQVLRSVKVCTREDLHNSIPPSTPHTTTPSTIPLVLFFYLKLLPTTITPCKHLFSTTPPTPSQLTKLISTKTATSKSIISSTCQMTTLLTTQHFKPPCILYKR